LTFNNSVVKTITGLKDISLENSEDSTNFVTSLIHSNHAFFHETFHRLFNLDSRLDIKNGSNREGSLINAEKREGMVEYLSRKCSIRYGLKKFGKVLNKENLTDYISGIASKEYSSYVDKIDKYLNSLAKLKTHDETKDTNLSEINYDNNRVLIEKMFVNFFLSGDREILDLAKKYGMRDLIEL
jgi:hypothetical protein